MTLAEFLEQAKITLTGLELRYVEGRIRRQTARGLTPNPMLYQSAVNDAKMFSASQDAEAIFQDIEDNAG